MIRRRWRRTGIVVATAGVLAAGGASGRSGAETAAPPIAIIGVGDSLTHGTMDATNNALNTANAYVQRVRNALAQRVPVVFSQPFYDLDENRIEPNRIPTNLAVDGADSFTIEGLDYYKRAGVDENVVSPGLLADQVNPALFSDDYDKVLFPINVLAGRPIGQVGSAEWLLGHALPAAGVNKAITLYWVGNNDSSTAALGNGGANPMFLPLPAQQLLPVLPGLSLLMQFAEAQGVISFSPYSAASIDRNLTTIPDFTAQNAHVLARLVAAGGDSVENHIFVLTLPYYSAVGYLMDSEDIEFYLRKVNPAYRVPPSFARVAPFGQPITNPLKGDRVSFLTFGIMYTLLSSGLPINFVNQVVETNGQQRDGLVLSEAEGATIRARIDGYNAALRALAQAAGPHVHVVEIGPLLNAVLTGQIPLVIDGRPITRKWIRGNSFGFDGVHPNYLGHTFIADVVIDRINTEMGLDAPLTSLESVLAVDPYIDRDGDGWAAGPNYSHDGLTEVLFLLKDPDDTNASVQVTLPPNVWQIIQDALVGGLLRTSPEVRAEAVRLGLAPAQ
jgi:lysophospholipase L1-like esterase